MGVLETAANDAESLVPNERKISIVAIDSDRKVRPLPFWRYRPRPLKSHAFLFLPPWAAGQATGLPWKRSGHRTAVEKPDSTPTGVLTESLLLNTKLSKAPGVVFADW